MFRDKVSHSKSRRNWHVLARSMGRRLLAVVSAAILAGTFVVVSAGPASATQACSFVQVSAGQWLGGGGVNVHSNGPNQGSGVNSCAGLSTANRAIQDGFGWQCVELAARLYYVKGWGVVYAAGNGGARYIPEGSGALEFHANGSGYVPVPGDLVIEDGSVAGHVGVIDTVTTTSINTVEQNGNLSGRRTYSFSGSTITGGSGTGSVRGFEHSPKNPNTNASGSGSFVDYQGNVYRIAGGAPIYVSGWAPFGGQQPTSSLSDAAWGALPRYPADGTLVNAQPSGQVFRIVGGAPIYVGSWDDVGGPQSTVTIGDDDIQNAVVTDPVSPWSHLRYVPADGAFISAQPSGRVFRFVGGAPIYIGSWDAVGGQQTTVAIGDDAVVNAGAVDHANPWSHVNLRPIDGSFLVAQPSGQVFTTVGGAPVYVGSWDSVGGPQPTVAVGDDAVQNAGATPTSNPYSHLGYYPADGHFVAAQPSGRVFKFTGGAPDYIASWESVGGAQPYVNVGDDAIDNAGAANLANPYSHVRGTLAAPKPIIAGTAAVGSKLTARHGTWSQTGLTYAYRWKRNGVSISGATHSEYTLTSKDRGKKITVVVTAAKPGFRPLSKVSSSTRTVS